VKVLVLGLAGVLGALGVVFLVGSQGLVGRMVVGVLLLAAAIVLVVLARRPTGTTTLVQKIELSGDVSPEQLSCRSCGAALSAKSIQVRAGAVFVHCPNCDAAYQLEEAPKW